jgi:hypothetical protein
MCQRRERRLDAANGEATLIQSPIEESLSFSSEAHRAHQRRIYPTLRTAVDSAELAAEGWGWR